MADEAGTRYYLDLFGASHMEPYAGTNPVEQLVTRVTLAFFNRYVLGQSGARATMTQDGNVSGTATLVSSGHLPPDSSLSLVIPVTSDRSDAVHLEELARRGRLVREDCVIVLLTITTTHEPASDLGFLLHKHPGRVQSFDESVGRAHVFYPEVSETRCTAALLLEVDPVGLVRGQRGRKGPSGDGFALGSTSMIARTPLPACWRWR